MEPTEAAQSAQQGSMNLSAFFSSPTHWPAQADLLGWCQSMSPGAACLLLMGGIVYLLFGVYLFKALVTLNAALVGTYVGYAIGKHADAGIVGAIVGGVLSAALTWPLMKYAVAMMGGIFGLLLGASLWRSVGLNPEFAWAGALTGLVSMGMLSFILFRASVMMYMSLQGSVMLIFGLLGLIYKYQDIAPKVTESMTQKGFLLPLSIFIPAVLGIIYQQTQYPAADAGKKK